PLMWRWRLKADVEIAGIDRRAVRKSQVEEVSQARARHSGVDARELRARRRLPGAARISEDHKRNGLARRIGLTLELRKNEAQFLQSSRITRRRQPVDDHQRI